MAAGLCGALVSTAASAREPLPTLEVVPSPRRVRLLDVRGPVQMGWGWSNLYRAPVYAFSFEAQASFIEITDTTWLHLTFGESLIVSAVRPAGENENPALLGLEMGAGLSRYAPRGPAFILGGTAGPRWSSGRGNELRPNGVGVAGKAEVFPFYRTIPEMIDDERGPIRRYVLRGFNVWVGARWDQVDARSANTYAAGIGLDMGRSLLMPVLMARHRRRR